MPKKILVAALALAAVSPWLVRAVSLVTFSDGTVASASDMNANFGALSEAIAARARWTPLEPIALGPLPTSTTAVAYDLPAQIPADAREVLVYARVYTGSTSPNGAREYRFHTVDEQDANVRYAKYLYVFAYGQDAVPYTSANLWLPVTAERKVHVTRTVGSNISGSFTHAVSVVGWR